nr:MAG TPA: hypothetical protein [Caudoviricetes sp.]
MKWQEDRKGDSGAVDDSPCHHNKRLSKRRRNNLIKKPENPVSKSDRYPSSLGKIWRVARGLLYSVK